MKDDDKIYAFDNLYTTNHIRIYKILLPALPALWQRNLALYIKLEELLYTYKILKSHPYAIKGCIPEQKKTDGITLAKEILPYCTPEEGKLIKTLTGNMDLLKQFESLQKMVPGGLEGLFSDFSKLYSSENTGKGISGRDAESILENMLNAGQKDLFDRFMDRFSKDL